MTDKTIMKPRPGGRGASKPAPADGAPKPAQPVENPDKTVMSSNDNSAAIRQKAQTVAIGDNVLVDEASTLFSLIAKVRNTPKHHDVNALKRQCVELIKNYEQGLRYKSVDGDQIESARYCLCSFIDEAVLNTPWGEQSEWGAESLLSTFHNETWGGEYFYTLLQACITSPSEHLLLLELQYLCLSLGFNGKMRVEERGSEKLEEFREQAYRAIRTQRKEHERELSPEWRVSVEHGSFEQKQDLPSLSDTSVDDITSAVDFVGKAQECEGLPPAAIAACRGAALVSSGLNPVTAAETLGSLNSYMGGASGTTVDLEGDDIGAEITLGTTFEFIPGHRLGLAYHYLTDFTFEGSATINGQLLSSETYQKQHTTLTWDMPERLVLSGSHRVNNDLNLYWDFERVFFDSFRSTDLRIDGYHTFRIDRNFKDANRYAVGGEYGLNERTILQLGFSYDESPVDDSDRMADIPVDDIFKTAFGAIYQVNDQLNVHGYVSLEFLGDAQIEQLASINGTKIGNSVKMDSDTTLYVFGVSFGYKF